MPTRTMLLTIRMVRYYFSVLRDWMSDFIWQLLINKLVQAQH